MRAAPWQAPFVRLGALCRLRRHDGPPNCCIFVRDNPARPERGHARRFALLFEFVKKGTGDTVLSTELINTRRPAPGNSRIKAIHVASPASMSMQDDAQDYRVDFSDSFSGFARLC